MPCPQLGLGPEAVPDRPRPGIGLQPPHLLVVAVEHGELGRCRSHALEQNLLRREVRLHVAVIVQVIAREIGEHRGVETDPVHPAQRQGVRRNLHGDVAAPGPFQFGEQPDQVERFRRRVHRRQHAVRQAVLDGADQGRGAPRGAQNRIQQVARRGLAIGAGDARDSQPFVGLAIEVARGHRQRLAAVRHADPVRREAFRRLRLADHRDRPARSRVPGESAAVGAAAREGEERVIAPHPSRIVVQPANGRAGHRGRKRLRQPDTRK